MSTWRVFSAVVLGAAAIGATASAHATYTWTFQDGGADVTNQSFTAAPPGGPSVTVTGWSTASSTNTSTFAAAPIRMWDGLGVEKTAEGNVTGPHSTDNYLGYDAALFSFSSAVSLSSATLGWNGTDNPVSTTPSYTYNSTYGYYTKTSYDYNDSDISVLYYTGSGNPSPEGKSISSLLSSGWAVLQTYNDVGVGDNTQDLTAETQAGTSNAKYSSYWLVMASLEAPVLTTNTNYTCGTYNTKTVKYCKSYSIDAVKIAAITGYGEPPQPPLQTPEPGSFALLAAGLSLLTLRHQRSKRNRA